MNANSTKRLIIGITGASGAAYGIRLLEILRDTPQVETHLVLSPASHITITQETPYSVSDLYALADAHYNPKDIAATISSGSYPIDGMIIAPCSMRTLGEIATATPSSLLTRAADVTLKERRKLVLLPRETPLHLVHLRHMCTVTEMGGIIAPPVPAFYNTPETLDDIINHTLGRVLDMFEVPYAKLKRWQGLQA